MIASIKFILLLSIFFVESLAFPVSKSIRSIRLESLSASRETLSTNSMPLTPRAISTEKGIKFIGAMTSILAINLANSPNAFAAQGAIKVSSIEETKVSVQQIKDALDGVKSIEEFAASKEWQKIGDLLSTSKYQTLENAYIVLVRSDQLSAEDKVSLGTIKRYGIVADALIMQGGLAGELRSGGVKVAGGGGTGIEVSDEDEEDDGGDASVKVNEKEVKRYIKLFKDSISDIYRIVQPILSK